MNRSLNAVLIETATAAIVANAEVLTRLDQAIGDGDHGINMKRGFEALLAQASEFAGLAPAEALHKAGTTLVASVGGASGALYGSLLLGMAKAASEGRMFPEQMTLGVESVKKRGRSDVGAKTLLDVLVPVLNCVRANQPLAEIRRTADQAREATKDMQARRGRASFLGARSRGHYDPGATSSQILVHAVCDALETLE